MFTYPFKQLFRQIFKDGKWLEFFGCNLHKFFPVVFLNSCAVKTS
jgi:hypothetical protein